MKSNFSWAARVNWIYWIYWISWDLVNHSPTAPASSYRRKYIYHFSAYLYTL